MDVRKAAAKDLPYLKEMYREIVCEMKSQGINI